MEKRRTASPAKGPSRAGPKARTPSPRMRAPRPKQPPVTLKAATPEALYRATGLERVQLIREGVPAERIEKLIRRMDIPAAQPLSGCGRYSRSDMACPRNPRACVVTSRVGRRSRG